MVTRGKYLTALKDARARLKKRKQTEQEIKHEQKELKKEAKREAFRQKHPRLSKAKRFAVIGGKFAISSSAKILKKRKAQRRKRVKMR